MEKFLQCIKLKKYEDMSDLKFKKLFLRLEGNIPKH